MKTEIWRYRDWNIARELAGQDVKVKKVQVVAYGSFAVPSLVLKSERQTVELADVWDIQRLGYHIVNGLGYNVYQFVCSWETDHHTNLSAELSANGLTVLSGSIWIENQ